MLTDYFKPRYILITSFCLIIVFFVSHYLVTKSDAFALATEYIKSNKHIEKQIGTVTKLSLGLRSSYSVSGQYGNAAFKIKVKGAKDKATVFVNLKLSAGVWQVVDANMFTSNNEKIPLTGT